MRQKRVYTVLASFNLLSAVACILLVQVLLATFGASLASNRAWSNRLDGFSRIVKLAGDANAPGNDVFEHKDVARARREEAAAASRVEATFDEVLGELDGVAPSQAGVMPTKVRAARGAFARMHASSVEIFDRLQAGDEAGAGAQMAGMDQGFAVIRDAMEDARKDGVAALARELDGQHATARRARHVQVMVAVLGLVVVLAVSAYGIRLAKRFDEVQRRLARQKDDMQLVFDNVAQGFLTVDRHGAMSEEHSRILERWFGPFTSGGKFWDYVTRSEKDALWLEMGFESVVEGFLPLEVALDQLPARVVVEGRPLRVEYRPVLGRSETGEELLEQLVLVFSDVTEEERRAKVEAEQQEVLALFENLGRDKEGVVEFAADGERMVRALCTEELDAAQVRHHLHTLKGTAGVFRQSSVATTCHEIESELADRGPDAVLDAAQKQTLGERWSTVAARVKGLVGDAEGELRRRIEIDEHEYGAVLRAAREEPRDMIVARMASWRLESTNARLHRLAEQTRALAKRLGKGQLDVRVEVGPEAKRLPAGSWHEMFSAMIHVVRNAVDHGVEPPEQRALTGKPETPSIVLRADAVPGHLAIEIEDDGRGVAWERVAEKGRALGRPVETHDDLVALLFTDGVSTRSTVSEISGRGVGLGAIYDACVRQGGAVEVRSEPGAGTCFRFLVPTSERMPSAAAA